MRVQSAIGCGVVMASLVASAGAQSYAPTSAPAADTSAAPSETIVKTLKVLENRPNTLKDFQSDVTYDVMHPRTGDEDGKTGTVDFVNDGAAGGTGLTFTVHFLHDTVDGKPVKAIKEDVTFDGRAVCVIDYKAKKFDKSAVPPTAGGAGALTNPVVLPIGLKTEDVLLSFDVTEVPGEKPGDPSGLKLVPKKGMKASFDFRSLVLTVDPTLELPVKVVRTEKNGDVTTVLLEHVVVNSGKAKMSNTTPPTDPSWEVTLK